MWHHLLEFILFSAVAGFVANAWTTRYTLSVFLVAAICSVLNLLYEAWLANGQLHLGWMLSMFLIRMNLAIPVTALTGLPWLLTRRLTDRWHQHPPTKFSLQRIQFWLAVASLTVGVLVATIVLGSAQIWEKLSSQFIFGMTAVLAMTQHSLFHLREIVWQLRGGYECEEKSE